MNAPPATFLPDPEHIRAELRACLPQFKQITWVEQTDSTNADLLAMARSTQGPLARPWVLGAHMQNRGRGRAGRSWQNRRGANLMFSCAFDLFLPAHRLPTLSPLVGLAACEALRTLLGPENRAHLTMKWPNDLLWKGAKLAGILVEATRAGTSRLTPDHYVAIVGMGVNLDDARALSKSLDRRVADWREIANQDEAARSVSACAIVSTLAQAWYESLNHVTAFGFDALPERYAHVDALAGQRIDIVDQGRLLHAGIACGINPQGQLLLRTHEAEIPISVGEVSVRPRQESY